MLGAHAGDNDQIIALAESLGRPFEVKRLEFNAWRHLGPRLLGRSLMSLTSASRRKVRDEPPPDLIISAGYRSVPVVRALLHRSKGRTRSIHLGFPRVSPDHFDLVIAPPQYAIPDHPNLLRIPYALTRVATEPATSADEARLQRLPRPRRLLIVGGPTLFWNLPQSALLEEISKMIGEARLNGGSLLVTTSPRTPLEMRRGIARVLEASGVTFALAEPGKLPALASLLAAADSIAVTADSVSMVSDSIWTGKPVKLLPVKKSALGKIAFAVNDAIRPGRRLYPQDLRFFWRSLEGAEIPGGLATPGNSTNKTRRMIADRVRPILEGLE